MPFPAAIQKLLGFAFLSLCLFAPAAHADEDDDGQADPSASRSLISHVVIHPDLSATVEDRYAVRILRESAIENEAQQELRYQESVDPVEILEAYTEKSGGRHIDVDLANILTRDTASGIARVYERDAKAITIVYPDVDAGDTVVYRSRTRQAKRRFSGHFYQSWFIPRTDSYEEFRLTVDLPPGIEIKAKLRGPGLTETIEEGGRRLVFTYHPGEWTPEESGAVSVFDREPGVVITTFNSFEEVAAGYQALDAGKAMVTPEIKALADTLTQAIPGRRRQAEAISNWVRKNIRYALVTTGSEGNTPNPAPTILRNRYGDCKDHMILTTALLEAKGIASERVAMNLGRAFQLMPLPMPAFNHAILYLPEFDLYDDPTDSQSAFGILQAGEYDKPVLRYSETGGHLARTPPMKTAENTVAAKTTVFVSSDGAVSGETIQTFSGVFASIGRDSALSMQRQGRTRYAERILRRLNSPGAGEFDAAVPWDYTEPYTLRSTFALHNKLETPLTGLHDLPIGMPLYPDAETWFFRRRLPGRKTDFYCYAGRMSEEIFVTFAEGLALPQPLEAVEVATAYFAYGQKSAVEDRVLQIRREFASLVQGQVCPSKAEEEIAPALQRVERSLKEQMAFGGTGRSALAARQPAR